MNGECYHFRFRGNSFHTEPQFNDNDISKNTLKVFLTSTLQTEKLIPIFVEPYRQGMRNSYILNDRREIDLSSSFFGKMEIFFFGLGSLNKVKFCLSKDIRAALADIIYKYCLLYLPRLGMRELILYIDYLEIFLLVSGN